MRLHVREEARVFAPPFHFCRGIATEPANSLADPPSPRTRVGQKGRLLPHEAPFSFSGRPPPDIHQQEGFLARLREHRIPRVLPWPERRHHGLVAELAPYAISFLVDFPDGIIADRERADYHKLGANMRTQTPPSRHWPASIAYLQLFTTVGQLYLAGPTPGLNAIALRLTRRRASHHQGCTPRNLGRTPDRESPPIGLSCPHNQ